MSWTWRLQDADGRTLELSGEFGHRADAETWIGEEYPELFDRGVAAAQLVDGDTLVGHPLPLRQGPRQRGPH